MDLVDLIASDAILPAARAGDREQVLRAIAARARDVYGLDAALVANGLRAREQQGTTAVGSGVAIPHAQIASVDSIVGVFVRLVTPVDFQAYDGRGVDLVFALLAPQGREPTRLVALARVFRLLHNRALCRALRQTTDATILYALITESDRQRKRLTAV